MILHLCATCIVTLVLTCIMLILTELYSDSYFWTHIIGGYILLILAAFTHSYWVEYYEMYVENLFAYFGIIFFCTSYLAFAWIYLWFHDDFTPEFTRLNKEFLLVALLFTAFLFAKKFYYLSLLLVCAYISGILIALCVMGGFICQDIVERYIYNKIESIRNYIHNYNLRPRRAPVADMLNPGLEELL